MCFVALLVLSCPWPDVPCLPLLCGVMPRVRLQQVSKPFCTNHMPEERDAEEAWEVYAAKVASGALGGSAVEDLEEAEHSKGAENGGPKIGTKGRDGKGGKEDGPVKVPMTLLCPTSSGVTTRGNGNARVEWEAFPVIFLPYKPGLSGGWRGFSIGKRLRFGDQVLFRKKSKFELEVWHDALPFGNSVVRFCQFSHPLVWPSTLPLRVDLASLTTPDRFNSAPVLL